MQTEVMSTTVVNTEKSTNFEESQKSSKDKTNGLKPLEPEKIDEITKSIETTIFIPIINNGNYGIDIGSDGIPYAYTVYPCPMTGAPLVLKHPAIIVKFDGINYHLYQECIVCLNNNIKYEYYPTGDDNANCSSPTNNSSNSPTKVDDKSNNEDSIPRDEEHNDDPDLNEMSSKLENLDLKYNHEISDEEFIAICVLLVQLAPFSKSIIESNGTQNSKFCDFFNRILEYVRSKKFNPDKNESDIMSILIPITEKNKSIKSHDKIFRNSKGRLIEDLKSILKFLSLLIPDHPKINGKQLGLKHPEFPYEYYENQLLNMIKDNLKNPTILRKMSILISLWEQTDGLEVFVDEASKME